MWSPDAGTTDTKTVRSEPSSHAASRLYSAAVLVGRANKPHLRPLASYLMQTEVHTFAFSVAANVILSFFPFIVLLLTLTRQVFHSQAMYDVVLQLLRSYLPAGQGVVVRRVGSLTPPRGMKGFFLALLLISSSGVV